MLKLSSLALAAITPTDGSAGIAASTAKVDADGDFQSKDIRLAGDAAAPIGRMSILSDLVAA